MRISLVANDQASPVVRRIYQALEQRSGSVAPYFRVLAHKPDVLRAFNQLHAAIWADGALAEQPLRLRQQPLPRAFLGLRSGRSGHAVILPY